MDFNKVISLLIPQGDVVSIQDEQGNKLWSIDKYAYGVRWNSNTQTTTACERIGNLELHKTLPIQSKFAVCIHQGTNIKYWCNPNDSRFRKDTTGYLFNDIKLLIEVPEGENSKAIASDYSPNATYLYMITVLDNNYIDNSEIHLLLTTYKYLYGFIKIDDKVCRINKINTDGSILYLSTNEIISIENTRHKLELGCSINGYDGEISVYTPPFYIWSHDNNGNNNEVYISEYKCISYAEKVKPHLISISRTPLLRAVLNDDKWGWLSTQKVNTALSIVNYRPELRGGNNDSTYDNQLGTVNFRSNLGKGASQMSLSTMRNACQSNGGKMLYYQIWKAIVWCYIIEYAEFNIKEYYDKNLSAEGYHQGGLGKNIISVDKWNEYNLQNPIVPTDFTLSLGNNTGVILNPAHKFNYETSSTQGNTTSTKLNQRALNVAHYRGFNVFWYGDSWINIDNFLSQYNSTKNKRIFYFTNNPTKFDNNIDNKEITVESSVNGSNWLKEITIGKQGNIIPLYIDNKSGYKQCYYWNNSESSLHTTSVGGATNHESYCGLLYFECNNKVDYSKADHTFIKCFILEN